MRPPHATVDTRRASTQKRTRVTWQDEVERALARDASPRIAPDPPPKLRRVGGYQSSATDAASASSSSASSQRFGEFKADGTASFHLNSSLRFFNRLKDNIEAWRKIGASNTVLRWIEEGYRLPLRSRPHKKTMGNHISAGHPQAWFVDQVIKEMLGAEAAEEVASLDDLRVVSPLNVAPKKGDNKWRLILDLRWVNSHCDVDSFTMQTLERSRDIIRRGDLMMGLDLASGYYHQSIHEDDWELLGFQWQFQGEKKPRFFQFKVLPFGGNFAPFCFETLMGQVAKYLRANGVRCCQYLDDVGLFFDPRTAEAQRDFCLKTFSDLGLVLNTKKSVGMSGPMPQYMKLLGTWIDTRTGEFEIDPDRLNEVLTIAERLKGATTVNAKELSRFAGKVASFSIVLGKVTWLYTRHLYYAIQSRRHWRDCVDISSPGCVKEIDFLCRQLESCKRSSLWLPSVERHDITVYSDAGAEATGALLDEDGGLHTRQDGGDGFEKESSAARELLALLRAMSEFAPRLRGKSVLFRTDAQAACNALHKGASKCPICHDRIVAIYEFCWRNHITPSFEWVPRAENQIADKDSKTFDVSDVRVSQGLFDAIDAAWGPHQVDLFANNLSAVVREGSRLPFYSYWYFADSRGDAFQAGWGSGCWAFPPFAMVGRFIAHAQLSRASGSVILPFSDSEFWWPLVCTGSPRNTHWSAAPVWADWVHALAWIPQDSVRAAGLHTKPSTVPLLALRFDFSTKRARRRPAQLQLSFNNR